jgi:hypothetical protein
VDIVTRVKALNFPAGEYCVFGSGVLERHGIRKAKDVDILVTKKLYLKLRKSGWKRKWIFWRTLSCKAVVNGEYEAFTNLYWAHAYRPDTEALIRRAEYFEGIPFLRLQDLLEFQRNLPREKDKSGVKQIEEFLANEAKSSSNIIRQT